MSECSSLCGGGVRRCENSCRYGEFKVGDPYCPKDQEVKVESCNEHQCRKFSFNIEFLIFINLLIQRLSRTVVISVCVPKPVAAAPKHATERVKMENSAKRDAIFHRRLMSIHVKLKHVVSFLLALNFYCVKLTHSAVVKNCSDFDTFFCQRDVF